MKGSENMNIETMKKKYTQIGMDYMRDLISSTKDHSFMSSIVNRLGSMAFVIVNKHIRDMDKMLDRMEAGEGVTFEEWESFITNFMHKHALVMNNIYDGQTRESSHSIHGTRNGRGDVVSRQEYERRIFLSHFWTDMEEVVA